MPKDFDPVRFIKETVQPIVWAVGISLGLATMFLRPMLEDFVLKVAETKFSATRDKVFTRLSKVEKRLGKLEATTIRVQTIQESYQRSLQDSGDHKTRELLRQLLDDK